MDKNKLTIKKEPKVKVTISTGLHSSTIKKRLQSCAREFLLFRSLALLVFGRLGGLLRPCTSDCAVARFSDDSLRAPVLLLTNVPTQLLLSKQNFQKVIKLVKTQKTFPKKDPNEHSPTMSPFDRLLLLDSSVKLHIACSTRRILFKRFSSSACC